MVGVLYTEGCIILSLTAGPLNEEKKKSLIESTKSNVGNSLIQ